MDKFQSAVRKQGGVISAQGGGDLIVAAVHVSSNEMAKVSRPFPFTCSYLHGHTFCCKFF